MIATLPTGRLGRLSAVSLALLALALFYGMAVVPLLDLHAENAVAIETRRTLVSKLNAISRELPSLRAHVTQLRGAADNSRLLVDGASDAIAAATLQSRIGEIAAEAGLTIGSAESIPSEVQGSYRRLGLRLVLNGSYEGLVKLLGGLETTTPPLIVENLQFHSFQRRPGAAPVALLDARLEVFGFRAAEPADVAKR